MTRDEAVVIIAARLGYASTTDVSSRIVANMKLVQSSLERDVKLARPWFLLTTLTDLTTAVGDQKIALPSDFLAEQEEGALWYYSSSTDTNPWVWLRKDQIDYCFSYYGADSAGAPEAYAQVGDYFWLFPTPDAAYTLKFHYYASDTTLTTNIENDWLKYAADLVIAETGLLTAVDLAHSDGARSFAQLRTEARDRFWRDNEARIHDNMSYTMGA